MTKQFKMKKPSKKAVLRLGYLLGLCLLAVVVMAAMGRKEMRKTNAVDVTVEPLEDGHYLIDSIDVLGVIEEAFGYELDDQPIAAIDIHRVEKVLERNPFVLDAEVYISALNKVGIEVIQRKPVLRVMDANGLNYYLDKFGNKLPVSAHAAARVLVVTGELPPYTVDYLERENHPLKELYTLSMQLHNDPFWQRMIEQIHVENGEYIFIPKVGRQKIYFGSPKNATAKLRRLRIFYDEVLPYKGWRKYKALDLRYADQVVGVRR